MCLAQGHNTMTMVTLEPPTPQSQVKNSTTKSLHSLIEEGHIRIISAEFGQNPAGRLGAVL